MSTKYNLVRDGSYQDGFHQIQFEISIESNNKDFLEKIEKELDWSLKRIIHKEKRYDDLKEYLEEQISELDDKISKQREKNHDIPINLFDDVFKKDLIKRSILLDIRKRL